ncbi:MAG: hypothetical protein ACKOEW_03545 [Methylocystis sp.]
MKYHDLETYYLNRRLELLNRLDSFAEQSLYEEDFDESSIQSAINMLKKQYSDVIDPENLCETLKKIYPEELFGIESREGNQVKQQRKKILR